MKRLVLIIILIILATGAYDFIYAKKVGKAIPDQLVQKATIDPSKILDGGPGKDGIPSVDNPKFTTVDEAKKNFKDSDLVLLVSQHNQTKAYPILIMNWHEIVNDKIDDTPIVVSYCPLCGSGITYKRILNGEEVQFGVSGKLYNSDLLMYDRKTESLWSQITGGAVVGPLAGKKLEMLDANLIDIKTLAKNYPNALVLSKDTGFDRDYTRSPYGDYDKSSQIYFPVENTSDKLFTKDRVIGIEINGKFKAYKFETVKQKGEINDQAFGEIINLKVDDKGNIMVAKTNGEKLRFINTFWFAWVAFHPDTEIYK